jgi:hypothetical protein
MRPEQPPHESAPFPWRVPPEAFSYHASKLRLLAKNLEQLGFPFALTNTDSDPLTVFVVVDCNPVERDDLSKLLESEDIGFTTSVITLGGYRSMLRNLGNHRPWVLADPSALLAAP